MSTILVTGGAGFIGSNFVRQWLAEEEGDLVNLDKLTYAGNLDSLADLAGNPRYHFVEGDIGDGPLVAGLLERHRPWAVLNFAAESHVDRSIDCAGGLRPDQCCRHVRPAGGLAGLLVRTGRAGAVGLPLPAHLDRRGLRLAGARGPLHRGEPLRPQFALFRLQGGGRPFCPGLLPYLRPANADHQLLEQLWPLPVSRKADPADDPQRRGGKAAAGVRRRPAGGRLVVCRGPLPGDPRGARPGAPGEVYAIGGDCQQTNLDVVRTIAAIVDRLRPGLPHAPSTSLVSFVADRPGHDRRYAIDAGKIDDRLGWRPREDFQSGLDRTVAWYLDNPAWVDRVLSGKYRLQRLGLGLGS